MRRHGTPKEIRDLTPFRSSCGGVRLSSVNLSRGHWQLEVGRRTQTIVCRVRLTGYEASSAVSAPDPYWELRIARVVDAGPDGDKLSRQFVAMISYRDVPTDYEGSAGLSADVQVCVGTAAGWADAIDVVAACGDVQVACAATGSWIYGEDARSQWSLVRIFQVQYPYRDPAEPNALLSPFHLVGPYGFDAESDGAVVSCFELKHQTARQFAERAKANAFLLGPKKEADGTWRYRLYHRETMTKYDVIDIDEWRARIIAGTRD